MRKTILALTAIFLAPTAAMALTSDRGLVGDSELGVAAAAMQKRQIAPGVAGSDQRGPSEGSVILAKGDKTGTGGGHGGHQGQKKGGNHGKQKKDKPK